MWLGHIHECSCAFTLQASKGGGLTVRSFLGFGGARALASPPLSGVPLPPLAPGLGAAAVAGLCLASAAAASLPFFPAFFRAAALSAARDACRQAGPLGSPPSLSCPIQAHSLLSHDRRDHQHHKSIAATLPAAANPLTLTLAITPRIASSASRRTSASTPARTWAAARPRSKLSPPAASRG